MENTENTGFAQSNENKLRITESVKASFLEMSKWSKFLSIMGFIGIGFMVLGGLMVIAFGGMMSSASAVAMQNGNMYSGGASSAFPMAGGMMIGVIYLLVALLYFFPIRSLYRYSTGIKNSMYSEFQGDFESAVDNLRSHYKFIGIFTIVVLSLYLLMFLMAIAIGIGSAM